MSDSWGETYVFFIKNSSSSIINFFNKFQTFINKQVNVIKGPKFHYVYVMPNNILNDVSSIVMLKNTD